MQINGGRAGNFPVWLIVGHCPLGSYLPSHRIFHFLGSVPRPTLCLSPQWRVLGLVELAPPWWSACASSSAKREVERERGKRPVDRLIQNNLDGREGAAMLGTKRGRSRRLPIPPAPREVVSSQPSLKPQPKTPKPKRAFEVARWYPPAALRP